MASTATADSGRRPTGWTPAGAGRASWRWWRHNIVAPVLGSPAAGAYAALWLIAAAYLVAQGQSILLPLTLLLVTAVFNVATVALTADPPPVERAAAPAARRRVGAQLAVALLVVGITGYEALAFHRLIPRDAAFITLWTPITAWFGQLGSRYLDPAIVGDPYNALFNPARYVLLLLPLLLLLGARPRELGFGRGHRTWRVLAVWCAIPLAGLAFALATGQLQPGLLGRRLVSNSLQNGFFEEFLCRGALQSRLTALLGPGWGLVLQALVFGLWHLGLAVRNMGGDVPAGIAFAIINQGTLGLSFGLLYLRTRNLAASSVVHVVSNTFSQML